MRRPGRLGILSIIGVSLLLVAAGLFILVRPEPLPQRAILQLDLRDELPEQARGGLLSRLLGWQEMTVLEVVQALDQAAEDDRVVAVSLRLGGLRCGLARAQDVYRGLARVRARGKPVVALAETAGLLETYMASAASEAYLLPAGTLVVAGIMAEVPFARGVLDQVGVYPDFVIAGEEKDSPDVYTRSSMSPLMRANMERLVGELHDQFVNDLAQGRGLDRDLIQGLVERGMLSAKEAVEAGLVDGERHPDAVAERLRELVGEEARPLTLERYSATLAAGWLSRRPVVAVVYAGGILVPGESVDNAWYGRAAGAVTLGKALRDLRQDEAVQAVVVRIDSPGGAVAAAEMLWRELRLTAEVKPVVISMGDYAASGGYYLAVAGDEIFAEPATLTGSIGVFAGKFALQGFYDWIGLHWEEVKESGNADILHDRLPWTEAQRQLMRRQVETVHQRFQEVVAQGRPLTREQVQALASGRAFTGREAMAAGLVDELGGLPQAVEAAARRAGLADGTRVDLRVYPQAAGLLASLSGRQASSRLQGPLQAALGEAALWDALARQRVVAYSPVRVRLSP